MFSIAWQWIRNLLTHFELQKKTLRRSQSQTSKFVEGEKKKQSLVRWLSREIKVLPLMFQRHVTHWTQGEGSSAVRNSLFSAENLLKWQMEIKNKDVLFCFNKVSICLPATKQKSFIYMSCIGAGLFFSSTWQQGSRVWKPEAYENCGFGSVSKSVFKLMIT